MSHELRTPLNAIIGFAELMHKGKVGPISTDHQEYLGDILISSRHLLQLVNDLLDLAKVESGKMDFRTQPVNLEKLVGEVRDIVRGLASSRRLRFETHIDPDVVTVTVDPSRLKQVLYNYLSNAIKFTPEGGTVTIRIRPEGPDLFRLDVEDTGIGISPENFGKLFVEFQQLDAGAGKRYQGTGLGLALTKRIIEAHGGRVDVRSIVGGGSTFSAILPRVTQSGEDSTDIPSLQLPEGWSATVPGDAVLVVDNDEQALKLIEATLRQAGRPALCVASAKEALELLETHSPCVLVVDLLMPGIDGFELIRRVREIPACVGLPIIVWTIKDLAPEEVAWLRSMTQAVLSKSVGGTDVLLEALDPFFNASGAPERKGDGGA
jgi:CheY-like chemotaxis protein